MWIELIVLILLLYLFNIKKINKNMLIISCILLIMYKVCSEVKENNSVEEGSELTLLELLEFKPNVGVIVWKDTSTTFPSSDLVRDASDAVELSITPNGTSNNLDSSLKNQISHIYLKSGFICTIKSNNGYLTETITNENTSNDPIDLNYYFDFENNNSKIYLLEEDIVQFRTYKFPSYDELFKFDNEDTYSIKPSFIENPTSNFFPLLS